MVVIELGVGVIAYGYAYVAPHIGLRPWGWSYRVNQTIHLLFWLFYFFCYRFWLLLTVLVYVYIGS